MKPLWLEVQNCLNDVLRKLFVEGFDSRMCVTTGNDKMHCNVKSKADMQGLKLTQHVHDN